MIREVVENEIPRHPLVVATDKADIDYGAVVDLSPGIGEPTLRDVGTHTEDVNHAVTLRGYDLDIGYRPETAFNSHLECGPVPTQGIHIAPRRCSQGKEPDIFPLVLSKPGIDALIEPFLLRSPRFKRLTLTFRRVL